MVGRDLLFGRARQGHCEGKCPRPKSEGCAREVGSRASKAGATLGRAFGEPATAAGPGEGSLVCVRTTSGQGFCDLQSIFIVAINFNERINTVFAC